MNTKLILTLLCLLGMREISAQNGNYSMGARSASVAGSSVTIGDEWALFNNIGGLSYHKNTTVFIGYKNRYGIPEFSSIAAGITHSIRQGTVGLGFYKFGDNLYNEQRMNLGFSNQFGIVSLGLNVNYFQLNIEGVGNRFAFMIDFGGQARLTEQIYFGAHVSNLNQARLSTVTDEKIPTIMKTGISYRPHDNLMLNTEVEKGIYQETILKIGLEYMILEKFSIATGFHTKPFEGTFGLGFHPIKFDLVYAFVNNSDLGNIHEVSFSYKLKR